MQLATAVAVFVSLVPAATPPDAVAIAIGGATNLHVDLVDGQLLVRESGGFGPRQGKLLRSDTLTPSAASWAEFWHELEQVDAFGWKTMYRGAESSQMDGVTWSVRLEHAGKSIAASGYNAYPGGWSRFMAALQKITAPKHTH